MFVTTAPPSSAKASGNVPTATSASVAAKGAPNAKTKAKKKAQKKARKKAAQQLAQATALAAAKTSATTTPTTTASPKQATWTDGATFGDWRVVFAGYGAVTTYPQFPERISIAPQAVTTPDATSAALVISKSAYSGKPLTVSSAYTTTQQLRLNSAPNPWEVGWLTWDYTDNEHFYYVTAKPNGWELGKRDPAYPGGQRFLATGSTPAIPVGTSATVQVARSTTAAASAISVTINGVKVLTFVDRERPYKSGNVGIYSEDAAVTFDHVSVNGRALRTK